MHKPNIIYMHSHDTGRQIEPYGHAVPAPNLAHLAKSGVLFRKTFCAAPTCSPSRAALLTGQSAHSSGMIGLAHRGFSLNDYDQHLVHALRSASYRSTLIGVQHVAKAENVHRIGYDEVVPVQNTQAEFVAPAAVDFLHSQPQQPFFLDIGLHETHREFPKLDKAEHTRSDLPFAVLPDTPDTRQDVAEFKASVRLLDDAVGAVLHALEEAGLQENTLFIYTTDHGPAFPDMKCSLTDHGIGVALIMRLPGRFDGGRTVDAMVSHIDIFPTLCDLLNIPRPKWLSGKSLLPILDGDVAEVNEELFAEVTYHAAYEPKRAVRTHHMKYIRRFEDRTKPVLPNCDDGLSKDVWMEFGWADRPVPKEQLYDLVFDPMERHNLVEDPSYLAAAEDMRTRLSKWMDATNDPLLHGPVSAPSGAQFNDVDGVSPREPTMTA